MFSSDYFLKKLQLDQKKYEELKEDDDPQLIEEFIEAIKPGLIENIGVGQLPKIGASEEAISDFLELSGYYVDFSQSPKPLLTSDRPCIFTTGLKDQDCVIALPLSPVSAFFAFREGSEAQSRLMNTSVGSLSKALNESVVSQAKERVYGSSPSDVHDNFLLKRLNLSDSSEGL